ncbi:MAG TPA: NAD(P)H-dependent glycerol-3-phosphate dehydrogenase [Planctomycetota bacterium]|nr:NAD(P)H-dependent glycerol-3-phosphate dehydrogenase [Planctomycetota bacterium]HRR82675.1 NAD(P)H-dependent glycerol-3-phosphate dehydrogenase [Planctomycetota bacterium]HRT93914.1 NAD(P)H-dependent glycerol-3-phosphate dehydrogenase [Planctomycetota bacterium]
MVGKHVTVIGDGGWGTALALLLLGKGHAVRLWGAFPDYIEEMRRRRENVKFLRGIPLPEALELASDLPGAVAGAEWLVMAVPTQFMRGVLRRLARCYRRGTPIVSVAKGIENRTLLRPTQIIAGVLGPAPVAALSGPSHAEEVARGLPATVTVASRRAALARRAQALFMTDRFRVYTTTDVAGVELGGAVKNVVAIAAGICDGLGLGDNAKSALLTRGLAEMTRLGVALGARRHTFAGLAGIGDLITTCASPFGRNRAVGVQIGQGKSLNEILAGMAMVAEGVRTTLSVRALARRHGVELPITEQVYQVLFRGKDPKAAVRDLMRRAAKDEVS